jgi:hypothetical protein
MQHLTSKEWYLWKKHSNKSYPWDRYINTDFLKSERKRINDVAGWMQIFKRVPYRASLDEVRYYVVPIKIKASWLTYFTEGEYICKGLSALRNCPIHHVIAFFPSSKKPTDYSLVRINSSKKIILLSSHTKSTTGEYAIIVEDWDELDGSEIYVDVPFERGIISKMLMETTSVEKSLAESIGAPLISSPFVLGSVGGISLASILDDPDSSQGLNIALQIMLPPEYRSFSPPKSGTRGRYMEMRDGISIHVAERIITGKNYVSSVEGSSFSVMEPEKRNRADFRGEYSILGAMTKSSSTKRGQLYKEMLHKFFESEVSIPNLSEQVDADGVVSLINSVDEDLWLQNVSMRQKTPILSISEREEENYRRKLKRDIDAVLCEKMPEPFRNIVAEMKVKDCMENLKREAKSLSRAEGKEKVDVYLLHHARNNFLDRFWQLEEDERFRDIKYDAKAEWNEFRSFNVESILIEVKGATIEELYLGVDKTVFKDIDALKGLLKSLQRKNLVIKDSKNRYIWV